MDNYIYKKDYTADLEYSFDPDNNPEDREIKEIVKLYEQLYKNLNYIIIPNAQKNFDRLVAKLDSYAKEYYGTIEAVIDYSDFIASITVVLSFFEFLSQESTDLLNDIAKISDNVTFTSEDNKVKMVILIPYFKCFTPTNTD